MDSIAQYFCSRIHPLLLVGASCLAAMPVVSQVPPASAPPALPANPTSYPTCQPPKAGEYLLLVLTPSADSQNRTRQVLPASARTLVCNYLGDVVTRVSGFTTVNTASAWARYMTESVGLNAFVARPPDTTVLPPLAPTPVQSPAPAQPPVAVQTPAPFPSPSQPLVQPPTPVQPPVMTTPLVTPTAVTPANQALAFNPRPLGVGYAVLVDYFNRPEVAFDVQQAIQRPIGLVSYGQRPYLLALYTSDPAVANTILQQLSSRGFWSMVVDSRRVVLLKQPIAAVR